MVTCGRLCGTRRWKSRIEPADLRLHPSSRPSRLHAFGSPTSNEQYDRGCDRPRAIQACGVFGGDLFKDQPYDIGRVYRPDGTWMGYYADVLEPVRWNGSDPATLEPIIDLFLDLWIAPDGRFEVLDEDEFEEAGVRGNITAHQIDHARRVLQDLVHATQRGSFPPAVVKEFLLRKTQPQEGH